MIIINEGHRYEVSAKLINPELDLNKVVTKVIYADNEQKAFDQFKRSEVPGGTMVSNKKIKMLNEAAEDALILDKDDKHVVASQINLNLKGEYDALDGYQKLIPFLEKYNDQESIDIIKEISSDEKNHAMLLNKILKKYDGDIPVAED